MPLDRAIVEFDKILRTLAAPAQSTRPVPGDQLPEAELSEAQRSEVAALMRVNHVGEICAQALYQGQAITSRDAGLRRSLEHAAEEETEHLAWTAQRIKELGGRTSLLNPLWYFGALGMGVAAGLAGDKWNLGFLAETERQVEAHLASHLDRIPAEDARSRAILEQMKADEMAHATTAVSLGAAELPAAVRTAMTFASRVMTTLAHRV
ncbi:2-polyprenyl-3-methyl-6-methoxy-1,4-benzoquinone monooxygenase [Uliginosibacterium sp. H3]|uniref:3-demethoxyubiquinol 3-hydroxylase n=1 Tax=Uliginosibacterium silvisoli TaxID=3114758 RepID=A0ABU6K8X8_9RHOO|nr:2-polyprenyl-3-methyl-6-methoxy-1,4-benzoquinone monooxygenase [Uliginosibacterium sp. H3]